MWHHGKVYKKINKKMKQRNFILFFTLFALLWSCSPVRKFNKLVEKHPHLLTSDTIKQIDTVLIQVPEVSFDTVFKTDQLHDTVYIEKERLKIKMYTVHDSIYIDAKCDTIFFETIIERKIPIKYYEKRESWIDYAKKYLRWSFILLLIVVSIILILRITKFLKNVNKS